jgi:hypothetical protein
MVPRLTMQEPPNWRKSMGLQLNLGTNKIGEIGITQLTKALSSSLCPVGLRLSLGGNEITEAGATQLANALSTGFLLHRLTT